MSEPFMFIKKPGNQVCGGARTWQKNELAKAAIKELRRRECVDKYASYCEYVHEGRWKFTKVGGYICEEVQKFIEQDTGRPYDIFILSMPPQHGKSMTITETLPSWYLGKWPNQFVIEISYNEDFSRRFGRKNKRKLEQFGREIFAVTIDQKPNTDTEFAIAEYGGGMISRGCMSGVTGNPCNLMIIDDPIKNRMEADSPTYRERLFAEWQDSYKTRLAAGAKVIVIQTRWHEDDLAGRLQKTEENVTVLNIPCEAEQQDPLGRKPGEALAPELGKGQAWLLEFKKGYLQTEGSRSWNAMFQGRPSSEKGNILKREWWQFYTTLPTMTQMIISVDAAFKNGENNDFVAIQAWGKKGACYYLIDRIKQHMDFPETLAAIRAMKQKYPRVTAILIEDKANGSAIIAMLKKEMSGIIPVNPEGGKAARVHAVSGAIESGNVYLPKFASFTNEFIEECAAFPFGAHDDEVDAMSQGLNRLIYYSATLPTDEDMERRRIYREKERSFLDYGV